MSPPGILITGVSGFVGGRLADAITSEAYSVVGVARAPVSKSYPIVEISSLTHLPAAHEFLEGINVVIHAAARVHVMSDSEKDPLAAFRDVNVKGTLNLARQAALAGVKRFIFISSIKVNGEQTTSGHSFSPHDVPSPEDCYGISKHEAEIGLCELSAESGMEVVIIRPPLVYGPGVKGNFASMIKLVEKGLPLPLGAVHNKRSLVALDNLIDLIITCIDHPAAGNQTFLVSDGDDLSTTQLLRHVAEAMGKSCRLIPIPAGLLRFGAILLGKKDIAQRLLGSLEVDISHTQKCLNWTPPLTVKQGLQRCFTKHQD
ncbi:UDP-glucose 4-epimerase family protein [Marinobacter xiaoshiensis]|uniref:SDR family oxidoreductase n=1 Tax=Marinobacter xiaoshiensis TaxID=3073652 RepID=A0ABU2HEJ6_9GAMM|nr:SDR family oxidoreductase [Marinobacter sp. F60267]MDS1309489.1 SDR family oxidoreductase [Marinobacter sp. F60267]